MNELTGKDKAIAQALTAYGYLFGGEGFGCLDTEAIDDEHPDPSVGILKNWIVSSDVDCVFAEEMNSRIYWSKPCEEDQADRLLKATVNLIKGVARVWDDTQGQRNMFEGENYAIAPPSTAVNC